MNYSVKLRILGNVQGVSFRGFAKRHAEQLGLKGYVKNVHDGTVEVVAEGNRDRLEILIETLRSGSDRSRVDNIEIEWSPFRGIFKKFDVIY